MAERKILSTGVLAVLIAFLVIFVDQLLKIYVKTHFYLGEGVSVLPFFELRFVQNNGMAFGFEFGSKLLLSLFRIIVVGWLIYYIISLCRRKDTVRGYVLTLTLIAAGAFGNIIDCLFYGLIFDNPAPPEVAHFVEWGTGYAPMFRGLVVDMLYFPLFSFVWPQWIPFVGGNSFSFFDPVFNIADAAITVGFFLLIFFYAKYISFGKSGEEKKTDSEKY